MRIPAGVLLLATLLGAVACAAGRSGTAATRPAANNGCRIHAGAHQPPMQMARQMSPFFHYELSRNARITLQFEDADGGRYVFREDEARVGGEYSVAFGGVVDGWTRPQEQVAGEVMRRLLPDGGLHLASCWPRT